MQCRDSKRFLSMLGTRKGYNHSFFFRSPEYFEVLKYLKLNNLKNSIFSYQNANPSHVIINWIVFNKLKGMEIFNKKEKISENM